MIDSDQLSLALTERFGLDVVTKAEQIAEGLKIIIRPRDIEYTISFQVEIILGWRTISAIFKPGNFAVSLVKNMKSATMEQKAAFAVFAGSLKSKGAKVLLTMDGNEVDPLNPEIWPSEWSVIKITMKKTGIIIESDSSYDFRATFPWATGFFGMSLALLPLEQIREEISIGEVEGASYYSLVKHYERSRINRAACIEIKGADCAACGFNFGAIFGSLGEGYIHIHHIVPVSQLGPNYVINPGTDLIPLCPNCHAMIHRRNPPLTLSEIFDIIIYEKEPIAADGKPNYKCS